jgi:hypothetical protein
LMVLGLVGTFASSEPTAKSGGSSETKLVIETIIACPEGDGGR